MSETEVLRLKNTLKPAQNIHFDICFSVKLVILFFKKKLKAILFVLYG